MKKLISICDKCGKDIDNLGHLRIEIQQRCRYVPIREMAHEPNVGTCYKYSEVFDQVSKYDLCDDCARGVLEVFNNMGLEVPKGRVLV